MFWKCNYNRMNFILESKPWGLAQVCFLTLCRAALITLELSERGQTMRQYTAALTGVWLIHFHTLKLNTDSLRTLRSCSQHCLWDCGVLMTWEGIYILHLHTIHTLCFSNLIVIFLESLSFIFSTLNLFNLSLFSEAVWIIRQPQHTVLSYMSATELSYCSKPIIHVYECVVINSRIKILN